MLRVKHSGIYGIFNTANGKVLVGSSSQLEERWKKHVNAARINKHENPHFQKAWNKYGEGCFEFRILEECLESMLVVREDAWMDYYHSLYDSHGYNMQLASIPCMSPEIVEKRTNTRRGYKMPEETKRKIGLANKGRKPSQRCIEAARKLHLGKKIPPKLKEKMMMGLKNRVRTLEERQKRSNSIKLWWANRKTAEREKSSA